MKTCAGFSIENPDSDVMNLARIFRITSSLKILKKIILKISKFRNKIIFQSNMNNTEDREENLKKFKKWKKKYDIQKIAL